MGSELGRGPWEAEVGDDPFRGAEGRSFCVEQSRRDNMGRRLLVLVAMASGDVHTGARGKDPSRQASKPM